MQDFNKRIEDDQKSIITTFRGYELILEGIKRYEGPITMQYLPPGGIQSVFDGLLVLNCRNGFFSASEVIYKGEKMPSSSFTSRYSDLVNTVLPN